MTRTPRAQFIGIRKLRLMPNHTAQRMPFATPVGRVKPLKKRRFNRNPAFQTLTEAEYLSSEATSPVKHEYVDGFVYPLHGQAGVSRKHSLVAGNIFSELHPKARAQGCRLHMPDMRLNIRATTSYFYPDVMLVCDPDTGTDTAEDAPCLLVEVLSPSTAAHDRIGLNCISKLSAYTAIPTLQTYLIVEQDTCLIYAFQRAGGWKMQQLRSGAVEVPCLGLSLSVEAVYAGVVA